MLLREVVLYFNPLRYLRVAVDIVFEPAVWVCNLLAKMDPNNRILSGVRVGDRSHF
ncbi:hypothetical protein D3C73_976770 [compost metagenome]